MATIEFKFSERGNSSSSKISPQLAVLSDLTGTSDFVCLVFAPVRFLDVAFINFIAANPDIIAGIRYFDSRGVKRPGFAPELLRGADYLGDVLIVTRQIYDRYEALLSELTRASKLDFVFAAYLDGVVVQHERLEIYQSISPHGGSAEVDMTDVADVVSKFLSRTGGGTVGENPTSVLYPSTRDVQGTPLISIVIPTQATMSAESDGKPFSYLVRAVESIVSKTTYAEYEFILVVDEGFDQSVISAVKKLTSRAHIVMWNKPFNFSEKMNLGVMHARGEYVLLLNDDIEVISPGWMTSMLALAQRPNAGMVGAMLYYEDDTIQHAGHAYYHGSPTHIGLGKPRGFSGPDNLYLVEREVVGVTAACALMPKSVFFDVGGFTALLPGNFNDVDLCLKVGWKGYDIFWTPYAELYHFESKTRDAHVHYYELDLIGHRWGARLSDDKYWRGKP